MGLDVRCLPHIGSSRLARHCFRGDKFFATQPAPDGGCSETLKPGQADSCALYRANMRANPLEFSISHQRFASLVVTSAILVQTSAFFDFPSGPGAYVPGMTQRARATSAPLPYRRTSPGPPPCLLDTGRRPPEDHALFKGQSAALSTEGIRSAAEFPANGDILTTRASVSFQGPLPTRALPARPQPTANQVILTDRENILLEHKDGSKFDSWLLLFATVAATTLTIFTIFYSYNAAITQNPFLFLLSGDSNTTVTIVNALVQSTIWVLSGFTDQVCECIRRSRLPRQRGTPLLPEFLALSPRASVPALIRLIVSKQSTGSGRFWAGQRFLQLIHHHRIVPHELSLAVEHWG